MIRGLQANWKLPCHDQAANNVAGVNYLKKDTKAIYTRQNRAYDGSILIGNIKIFNIFDVPHLLKTVRNSLLNADLAFKVNGQVEVASWRHIEQMYEEDKGKDIRAVPNLTDFHIKRDKIRKTKVKYCSQVFSQRVASQIQMLVDYAPEDVIHQDARHTVQILHFFNQLFDSMNSSKYFVSGNSFRCATSNTSDHIPLWNKSIEMIKGMYFIKGERKFVPPSLKNWVTTLENNEAVVFFEQERL